jgi:hypothetical protein
MNDSHEDPTTDQSTVDEQPAFGEQPGVDERPAAALDLVDDTQLVQETLDAAAARGEIAKFDSVVAVSEPLTVTGPGLSFDAPPVIEEPAIAIVDDGISAGAPAENEGSSAQVGREFAIAPKGVEASGAIHYDAEGAVRRVPVGEGPVS